METFTSEKVRLHLERILATRPFLDSVVLTRFLKFIVNETLEGRSHELKEYTIAVDALKKDPDFNPQIDSIVRIHAGRLRRALKEYYYEEGSQEELQILVRKGSYVPVFVPNPGRLANNADDHPVFRVSIGNKLQEKFKGALAVLPFEDISEVNKHAHFTKGLDFYLSTCLTNHPQLSVVSYLSTAHLPDTLKDVREAGHFLNASFILTGCVQFDKDLRVHAVLNACETGEQLWGITIDKRESELVDLFRLQEEIVTRIGTSVNSVVANFFEQNPPKTIEPVRNLRVGSR